MQNNELKHYGVIGMKWGMHRARNKGTTYKYTSRATKKYMKKAANAKDDYTRKEFEKRAKRSAEFDRRMQSSVAKSSTGKTAAKLFLNGPFGSKTYEAAKAAGNSRAKAGAITIVSSYLGGPIGNMAANAIMRYDYVNK